MSDERRVEQLLAQARAHVAARQIEQAQQRWGGSLRWVLLGLVLAVLVAFLAAPGTLPYKLLLAMGGVCALRPDHSYFMGDIQLPLEARMTGIYGGFLLNFITLLLLKRWGAHRLGESSIIALVAFFSSVWRLTDSTQRLQKLAYRTSISRQIPSASQLVCCQA